jgi:hypothetical protein
MQRVRPLVCSLLVTVSEQLQVLAFLVASSSSSIELFVRGFLTADYDR